MTEEKEKKKEPGQISRREFLKDAGLVVGGAAIGATVLLAACKGGEGVTETVTKTATVTGAPGGTVTVTGAPGGTATVTKTATVTGAPGGTATVTTTVTPTAAAAPTVKLTVNRWPAEVYVQPEDTLRDVLRDKLGFTSLKDMCNGYGACGSCTVIKDGRPVLSCMILAIECDGATIETAEGLADANHPLIEAYVMNHCMQCGYCTPGFILTSKALLDRNPKPTEVDIRDALGGNICRCATYPMHIIAVQEAAKKL